MHGHPSLESLADETARLRDEMEQLRAALEGAVEDNIRLVEDRDRLRGHVTMLARELQAANAPNATAAALDGARAPEILARSEALSHGEGELRVAFEELQDRQAVLLAELQHRTRNLMAVVETVIRKTLASSKDIPEARGRIEERFGSLARVQGLLSRRPTGGRVSFDVLLSDELAAHVPLTDDPATSQVSLEGPAGIELRSTHVQTLALALHELTTNAVKYGALAHPGGRLTVGWAVREVAAGERRLVVDWRETGVPGMPPSNPDAARGGGYGRQLIERALPYQLGATTAFGFGDDGVHCTIELPLPAPDRPGEPAHV